MTLALPYLYLALAIVFEVVGTSALKASETFTRLVPSLVSPIRCPLFSSRSACGRSPLASPTPCGPALASS